MNGRRLVPWAAIGGLALILAVVPVSAQKIERVPAKPIQSVEGVDTFNAYCAVCHGTNAKGTGPAAKALAKAPADLTTIAKRHGRFSQADVEEVVLGTHEYLAHGTRDMPIWGPIMKGVSGNSDSVTTLRVNNLVAYIKSIQTQ
jgi:mono/diheme cytochrome c family protein